MEEARLSADQRINKKLAAMEPMTAVEREVCVCILTQMCASVAVCGFYQAYLYIHTCMCPARMCLLMCIYV